MNEAASPVGERPIFEDLGEAEVSFEIVDQFTLMGRLGEGGMGEVFHARHLKTGREVALKLLREAIPPDRFRHEIATLARLSHPGIVSVIQAGEHRGRPYYAMDYVDGLNLAQRAAERPFSVKEAVTLIRSAAQTVHYAHEQDVLHRDLKPQNLLLGPEGQIWVTDFGLARSLDSPALTRTASGAQLGTPSYMAPEQVSGKRECEGPATDVYGLGATLYQLLTGAPPFHGDTIERTLRLVLDVPPAAPHLLNPAVDRDLETLVLTCLEKNPGDRFSSAAELADELDRWSNGEPILRRPPIPLERLYKWGRRRPLVASLALATTGAIVLGLVGIAWQWTQTQKANTRLGQMVRELGLGRSSDLFEKELSIEALALLARQVREFPNDHASAKRLLAALTRRNYPLPLSQIGPMTLSADRVRWSPNGRKVLVLARPTVSGPSNCELRLWDTTTGRPLSDPVTLDDFNGDAWFSQDGHHLLTTLGHDVRLWNATNLQPNGEPFLTNLGESEIVWHPDSRSFFSLTGTNRVVRFDLLSRQRLAEFPHSSTVRTLALSVDGQRLALGGADGSVRLWSTLNNGPLTDLLTHSGSVLGLNLNADGSRLAVMLDQSAGNSAVVLSQLTPILGSPELLARPLSTNEGWLASFSPDGQRLLLAGAHPRLLDANTGTLLADLPGENVQYPHGISPSGEQLAAAQDYLSLHLLNPTNGVPISELLPHRWAIEGTQFSPSGHQLAVSLFKPDVVIWDTRPGGSLPASLPHAKALAFSPNGRWLVTGGSQGRVEFFNRLTSSNSVLELALRGNVWVLAFSPDSRLLLVTTANDDARILEPALLHHSPRVLHETQGVAAAAFSPNGKILATLTQEGMLRFWQPESGTALAPALSVNAGLPNNFGSTAHSVGWNPEGTQVVVAGFNGFATVWEAGTTNRLIALDHAPTPVLQASFSPDSRWIATAAADSVARLWEARTGHLAAELRHSGEVRSVDFSPDGRFLLTADLSGSARIWRVSDGRLLATARGPSTSLTDARFNPDGSCFATAAADHTIRIWDTVTGLPLDEPISNQSGHLTELKWSPDGRQLAWSRSDGAGGIVEMIRPGPEAPPWLAEITEALSGQTVDFSPGAPLLRLRQRLAESPGDDFYARWVRWFFADRSTRSRAP